jgi:sigma-E factor negative regulatory protein RseA
MADESGEHAQLSALADGELDVTEVAQACVHWHSGTSSRETWYAYHLIGDVLRSDDLASDPRRDHASLQRLRDRLVMDRIQTGDLGLQRFAWHEPSGKAAAAAVPRVAHGASAARSQRRSWPWAGLSAIAAGFAAVAATLFVLGRPVSDPGSTQIAGSETATPARLTGEASRPFGRTPQPVLADSKLVRDARLDRYLDAHKHFSGVSALGVPSTFLRGATSDATNR